MEPSPAHDEYCMILLYGYLTIQLKLAKWILVTVIMGRELPTQVSLAVQDQETGGSTTRTKPGRVGRRQGPHVLSETTRAKDGLLDGDTTRGRLGVTACSSPS